MEGTGILRVFRELKGEILKMFFIEVFLNAVLFFLVTYLVFSILRIPIFLVGIALIIFFIGNTIYTLKRIQLSLVEEKYPSLREMLRTSADNIHQQTFMARALHYDVALKIRAVKTSSFMSLNRMILKIFAIFLVSFFVIYASSVNIRVPAWHRTFDFDIKDLFPWQSENTRPPLVPIYLNDSAKTTEEYTDIYGGASFALLGDEELIIEIQSLQDDISFDKVNEEDENALKNDYPEEVFIAAQEAYQENIPREQQELVKSYFTLLRDGEDQTTG